MIELMLLSYFISINKEFNVVVKDIMSPVMLLCSFFIDFAYMLTRVLNVITSLYVTVTY